MIILLKKRKNFKNCKYSRLPIETKTRMQVHQKQEGNLSLVPQQASRKFLFDHDSLADTRRRKILTMATRSSCSILSLQKETRISKNAASNYSKPSQRKPIMQVHHPTRFSHDSLTFTRYKKESSASHVRGPPVRSRQGMARGS